MLPLLDQQRGDDDGDGDGDGDGSAALMAPQAAFDSIVGSQLKGDSATSVKGVLAELNLL